MDYIIGSEYLCPLAPDIIVYINIHLLIKPC